MRLANIEVLRGLLMFFVVGCHVLNMGANAFPPLLTSGINYYFTAFYDSFFMMAVDCFVIISGYFGIKLKATKIVTLLLPVYFYSLLIGGIAHIIGYGNLSLSHFLPLCSNSYWFLTSYLLLCLFTPFLNSFVEKFNLRSFFIILCAFYFFFSIVPSFSFFSLTHDDGFGVINFVLMYLTGRFLKQVKWRLSQSWRRWFLYHILFAIIVFSENVLANSMIGYNRGYQGLFWHYDNIFIILGSISLFMTFLNLRIDNFRMSQAISWLSPSFFYIYIIHCTSPLGSIFFNNVGKSFFLNSSWFPLYVIVFALFIFIICLFADILIRRVLFKRLFEIVNEFVMKLFRNAELMIFNLIKI